MKGALKEKGIMWVYYLTYGIFNLYNYICVDMFVSIFRGQMFLCQIHLYSISQNNIETLKYILISFIRLF